MPARVRARTRAAVSSGTRRASQTKSRSRFESFRSISFAGRPRSGASAAAVFETFSTSDGMAKTESARTETASGFPVASRSAPREGASSTVRSCCFFARRTNSSLFTTWSCTSRIRRTRIQSETPPRRTSPRRDGSGRTAALRSPPPSSPAQAPAPRERDGAAGRGPERRRRGPRRGSGPTAPARAG